ncbi:MAG: hypothetical protein F6K54_24380 [Okeania sp. SIO3B5]|uniref:hypothetical protein n=1 Tax=Okeania sp. SIO3B5 TaxID=2607811 RepID=UPI0013FFAC7A|nr:hypothetical protein [Okeania sp. SIO3B5]NEO55928.1 hypothetical protein [Okeania sp. SIO3B5]
MTERINDIFIQARQGSVAAIIQVLNQQLATLDVRIRAIFSDGVLQLLCEAPQIEQLEQSHLVKQVKHTLEDISPRNIRKVNINSRIVQEQQLLWLDEIIRDPKDKLLWSQQITLTKPNIFKQIALHFQTNKPKPIPIPLSTSVERAQMQKENQFQLGMMSGFFLSLLMLVLGIQVNKWLNFSRLDRISTIENTTENTTLQSPNPTIKNLENTIAESKEAFAQAVRLAQEAAADGKTAQSQEEWTAIASKWQQASQLMASVSPNYSRYDVAVNRAELYQKYSDVAKQEADKI